MIYSKNCIKIKSILIKKIKLILQFKNEMKIFGSKNIKTKNKTIKVSNLLDHRICMATICLSLLTGAKSLVKNFETVDTSSPSFLKIIRSIGGQYEVKKK